MSDTVSVRESEQLNWVALDAYIRPRLAEQLGDLFDSHAPLEVEQFAGGHSNLTYLLRFGRHEFALRRPPFGPVAAKAHDMARECRLLSAVNPVFPLAPKPFLLCEDPEIVGSTFYLMERRHGLVIRHDEPEDFSETQRHRASKAVIDVLADLHSIDVNSLSSLGKPSGFVERQVRGWTERWHKSKTSDQVAMDQLAKWLIDKPPPDSGRAALLHGDYKLDNIMFDPEDVGRLVAVFDWEMSALGDPLVDLGIFLAYWIHFAPAAQDDSLRIVTTRSGWSTRDEILEQYSRRTGLDVGDIRFFEVFAVFKVGVILQQIFYRYHRGQTDDRRFAYLDKRVDTLAQIATALAS